MTFSIAINFLLFATIIQVLIGVIFFFISLARRLLLHSVSMFLILIPYFIHYHSSLHVDDFTAMLHGGFCLFPVTLGLMVQSQYAQERRNLLIPVYLVSAASFFMIAALPFARHYLIFAIVILTYGYVTYLICSRRRDIPAYLFVAGIAANAAYLAAMLPSLKPIHSAISAGVVTFLATILFSYHLRRRINAFQTQFAVISEQNKELIRSIARLKQSGDQYRNLIVEKDRQMLQLARHASLAELTTGIGHELAQPLTGIRGIAQNLIDDINAEELDNLQAVSELMRICSLVDKASSIIDHIRNFSRRGTVSMKPLDLNRVILEAIDLIQVQLKKNNIDLIFVLDENIPKIQGDRLSLEQLIVNIVMNAKDAILEREPNTLPEGGSIRIATYPSPDGVTMTIEDNGTGMPEEIKNKIWSPFFTTKKGDRGTGIGLALCGRILRDHGAQADIHSDANGTRFTIRFPPLAASA